MNKQAINQLISKLGLTKDRNVIVVDFANVDRWQESLGWTVGIKQLGQLITHISQGKKYLRRFYYGQDYGPHDSSTRLTKWSDTILTQAQFSKFAIISKRVKYIPDAQYATGFIKKCNLDIEMAVDLIREQANYDTAIIFSGDGDLAYVCDYLKKEFNKTFYIFGARDRVGKELMDAKQQGTITDILFAEDFEYRLNLRR
jgi:uncharacterized LabA/DUF88 family protein